jgi:xanthine dehydrogenase YagS FAD-binding subunit
MHAVLGVSEHCIAAHPSDMAVAMIALDAQVETVSPDGSVRTLPVADLHRLPEATPHVETNLRAGELITAVMLPEPPRGRQIYRKVRDRASYAFALASVAAVVDAAAGTIRAARLALGGVAHKPWRAREAEQGLAGVQPERSAFNRAAEIALNGARGHGHNDFKIPLAKRTIARTLADASVQA